jgi:hypothetical protein
MKDGNKEFIPSNIAEDAKERFFDVEVRAGTYIEIGKVLLAMEGDGFCLHLSLLGVHLNTINKQIKKKV